jgi:hypothetical protein
MSIDHVNFHWGNLFCVIIMLWVLRFLFEAEMYVILWFNFVFLFGKRNSFAGQIVRFGRKNEDVHKDYWKPVQRYATALRLNS